MPLLHSWQQPTELSLLPESESAALRQALSENSSVSLLTAQQERLVLLRTRSRRQIRQEDFFTTGFQLQQGTIWSTCPERCHPVPLRFLRAATAHPTKKRFRSATKPPSTSAVGPAAILPISVIIPGAAHGTLEPKRRPCSTRRH